MKICITIEGKGGHGALPHETSNEDLSSFELPEEHKLGLSIAFQKGSPLTAEFNHALTELQDKGEIDELVTKWFSN